MGNRHFDVDPFMHDASRALVDMAERLSEFEQSFLFPSPRSSNR